MHAHNQGPETKLMDSCLLLTIKTMVIHGSPILISYQCLYGNLEHILQSKYKSYPLLEIEIN